MQRKAEGASTLAKAGGGDGGSMHRIDDSIAFSHDQLRGPKTTEIVTRAHRRHAEGERSTSHCLPFTLIRSLRMGNMVVYSYG